MVCLCPRIRTITNELLSAITTISPPSSSSHPSRCLFHEYSLVFQTSGAVFTTPTSTHFVSYIDVHICTFYFHTYTYLSTFFFFSFPITHPRHQSAINARLLGIRIDCEFRVDSLCPPLTISSVQPTLAHLTLPKIAHVRPATTSWPSLTHAPGPATSPRSIRYLHA